ncbi:MAG: hemerythrin family protein [Candidatus Thiodiazotropha sp. (ex Semelilucina semeliformis)]|nr:hemerythrin family protein [Candidatus Thiodiazotropha sp. (ex Semelilucina semeliformis)]MCU7830191.1 hemerythrin family protein [Candidatus Thiodiazotropha sp. (ex Myrtea sp. 'scaly one' KF741663)]
MIDNLRPLPDPSSIPLVALESMNETHREELEMVNRLGTLLTKAMEGEADEKAISAETAAWVEHTRLHFKRENELMLEYGFPAYPVHSSEHERMLALLDELHKTWLESHSVEPLVAFLFESWPEWFEMHVNTMDSITAQFINQRGGA